ncbi:hypothetical protein ACGFNY_45385 [Streptomyces chartreusis]|uniref:hypothetical protein n=1 Tax=Streptomyces chartreusis TaxID=1969 RepID=UPI003715375F
MLWLSGMLITADRLNNYDLDDETTAGFVIASGWTLNNFWANRSRSTVEINIYVLRSGADIVATSGNISDALVGTLPSGWRPNSASTLNGAWDDGTASGGWVVGTDGLCTLRTSSSNIVTNRNVRMHITYNKEP